MTILAEYLLCRLFETIPPKVRDKVLNIKKSFLSNLDLSQEETIVMAAITPSVLENKPRKKRKRKLWLKLLLQIWPQLEGFNILL